MRRPEDVRVLIVDDEPDIREFLASVLADAGMQVETAADGEAALRKIRAQPPDLVSLDLVMPGKSGIRLLHDLRRDPDLARLPVLVVTGHASDPGVRQDLEGALSERGLSESGALLEKPVTPHGYLRHVCRLLQVAPPAEIAANPDNMRREARDLLEEADAETLARILENLRRPGADDG